jgi:hypothetical protein
VRVTVNNFDNPESVFFFCESESVFGSLEKLGVSLRSCRATGFVNCWVRY